MTQASLFDAPATRGASRASDPATSREAGRSMSGQVLRDQQALVLSALCALHRRLCRGGNAFEVQCHLGPRAPQQSVISKRLGELVERGMVEPFDHRPGPSSRQQIVYRPTREGSAWISSRGES